VEQDGTWTWLGRDVVREEAGQRVLGSGVDGFCLRIVCDSTDAMLITSAAHPVVSGV
jgi:hypothetical protein